MDALIKAFSPSLKLRVAFADVTVTAKALEARHLAGPTSALVLAESLAAVALLSADVSEADECISLRMHVTGPVRGVLVEASAQGHLRGFTNVKVLNDLDGAAKPASDGGLGDSGAVNIISSRPGKILGRTSINAAPPKLRHVLARYFNYSMQAPTGVEIESRADPGGLIHACGLYAQRMVDGSQDAFVRILEDLESGAVRREMAQPDPKARLAALLKIPDLEVRETRPLQFLCRCTREKTLATLDMLKREELTEIVAAGKPQRVFCHMCSAEYSATVEEVKGLLEKKAG
jgi:molecular chaperone Hsp33